MELLFTKDFYFKYKCPNSSEFIEYLENTSVHQKDGEFIWGENCMVDKIRLCVDDTLPYLIPSLKLLYNDLKVTMQYNMTECWINQYSKLYNQEIHDHYPSDLVCVFFMNDGPNFSNFYFFDRNGTNITPIWHSILPLNTQQIIQYNTGDIIFFPGHLLHGVSPHKGDEMRKTFSCNFNMYHPN